ncbi:MAG: DUF6364 family protein [Burkholderiales bacterium]
MNLTLSIDQRVAEDARKAAQAMGKSLNQVMREYLEQLAGHEALEAEIAELRASSAQGSSEGTRFNREDVYQDRLDR